MIRPNDRRSPLGRPTIGAPHDVVASVELQCAGERAHRGTPCRAPDAVRRDVARLACDAYERAMQEPYRERAVEVAVQVLGDVCS